jgi:putative hydrolase of the HAD superfamily
MIKGILFDLDDTLLHRRRSLEPYLTGLSRRLALSDDVALRYRARFHDLDGGGATPRSEVFRELSDEFPAMGSASALGADFIEHAWRSCEYLGGAMEVLAWCRHRDLRCGIITNGSRATQRAKVHSLDLESRVDTVLISEEEGIAKPAADIFIRAASRLGLLPNECAFVGDNPVADIAGARDAGMFAIWFRRDLPWPVDLAAAPCSISALSELPNAIELLLPGQIFVSHESKRVLMGQIDLERR